MGFISDIRDYLAARKRHKEAIEEPAKALLYDIYTDGGALRNGKDSCKASWAFVVPFPPEWIEPQVIQVGVDRPYSKLGTDSVNVVDKTGLKEGYSVPIGGVGKKVPIEFQAGTLKPLVAGEWHTNNKGELMAIIQALAWAKEKNIKRVRILSDSQYAIYCINQHVTGWQRKKNIEYFAEIDKLAHSFEEVDFAWIAGHQDNSQSTEAVLNSYADGLCRDVLGIPRSYRPTWNQTGMTANRSGFTTPRKRKHYSKRR